MFLFGFTLKSDEVVGSLATGERLDEGRFAKVFAPKLAAMCVPISPRSMPPNTVHVGRYRRAR